MFCRLPHRKCIQGCSQMEELTAPSRLRYGGTATGPSRPPSGPFLAFAGSNFQMSGAWWIFFGSKCFHSPLFSLRIPFRLKRLLKTCRIALFMSISCIFRLTEAYFLGRMHCRPIPPKHCGLRISTSAKNIQRPKMFL